MNFPKSFFRKRPSIAVFMHRVGSSYTSQPRLWALLFLVSMMSVSDILFAPVFPFPTLLRWTVLVGVAALKASLCLLLVAILHAMGKLRRIAPILVALYVLAALVNFDDRDFIGRDVRYVEVPMFIYMNAAFRHRHPQLAERAASSVTLPISTANTVYALMTLGGVGYPLYDSSRDFLNPAFRPRVRYVDMELWHPSARRN